MQYPNKAKLKQYQQNPELWLSEVLDDKKRWRKQIEVINSVRDNRITLVKSAHGMGKTFCAKDVVLWFLYNFYPAVVITTAPSWAQVEKLLWAEINFAVKSAKVTLGGSLTNTELKLNDDWFALGISPRIDVNDDGKRMTGFHSDNVLVVFDEAPDCAPKLWEISKTIMTSANVKFLGIGNPVHNTGHFYNGFRQAQNSKISISIFDSPNFIENDVESIADLRKIMIDTEREKVLSEMILPYPGLTTPRWAVERLEDWGEDSPLFASRVLGDFPRTTTDTIISLTDMEKCANVIPTEKHAKVLGVDVARFGADDTVFYGYEHYSCICREKFNGQNLVKTAERIKYKIKNEGYRIIVIDDTGLGGGVTDILTEYIADSPELKHVKIMPVNFAQKSEADEYDGIVTQMYFGTKKLIEDLRINIKDEGHLYSDLSSRKYKFKNGKIKIESKDEYKKRTGSRSPDDGDAFVLCMWGIQNLTRTFFFDADGERDTANMDF